MSEMCIIPAQSASAVFVPGRFPLNFVRVMKNYAATACISVLCEIRSDHHVHDVAVRLFTSEILCELEKDLLLQEFQLILCTQWS